MQKLTDLVLNKQWSIVVGLLATGIAFALTEYAEDIPVEIVPILAAIATWLRVWSKASVEELVANVVIPDEQTIGDDL